MLEEHADSVLQEKSTQCALVFGLTPTVDEPGPKLAEHDERHDDRLRALQELQRLFNTSAQVNVAIRVERNSQRQSAWST